MFRQLNQRAIYWSEGAPNEYGEKSIKDPHPFACRWEKVYRQVLSPEGVLVAIDVELIAQTVLEPGTVVSLGSQPDFEGPFYTVISVEGVPDSRGEISYWVYGMSRYRNS